MAASDEIRPYADEEVNAVIQRLIGQRSFLDVVGRFRVGRIYRFAPPLVRLWIWLQLRTVFGGIHSVDALQKRIMPIIDRGLERTTEAVSWSGLEDLEPGKPCLFVSSHRDIVMDSVLVNHALYSSGMATTRIAIGDNLTSNPMVADLMRLNKSFIVRRNLSNAREMRNTFLTLSQYIRESLTQGHSVWIAQRQGRAKNSVDTSDPAIIKMLYMSHKREGLSLGEAIARLRIVPVAVSYEFDPCDREKARELEERYRTGHYEKRPDEDVENIVKGIVGHKGRIHVAFGAPLEGDGLARAEDVSRAVDRQILSLMRFYPVHYAAAEKLRAQGVVGSLPDTLTGTMPEPSRLRRAHRFLDERLAEVEPPLHPWLLGVYANALLRWHDRSVRQLQDPAEEVSGQTASTGESHA